MQDVSGGEYCAMATDVAQWSAQLLDGLNDTLCSSIARVKVVYEDTMFTIVVNSWTQCTQRTRKLTPCRAPCPSLFCSFLLWMLAVEQLGHAQVLGGQFQTSGPVLVVGPSGQRKTVAVGVPRILVCSLVWQNRRES